jgi:transcriptional/translational regulatory protein YebC/TACO1
VAQHPIIVAARAGGGNPDANLRLRLAIQKAREASMPQDTIKRGIMRGTGELEGTSYDEITYEGYGPGGVAVMVDTLTDNRNRTVAELRNIFSKDGLDEDAVMMAALDAGAEDVRAEEETFDVVTAPEDLPTVRDALTEAKLSLALAEVTMLPRTTVDLKGKEAQQMLRLMEMLEDHDDVQHVYANFDIAGEVLAALS